MRKKETLSDDDIKKINLLSGCFPTETKDYVKDVCINEQIGLDFLGGGKSLLTKDCVNSLYVQLHQKILPWIYVSDKLNRYFMLDAFIRELAHHYIWFSESAYVELMQPLLDKVEFPPKILELFKRICSNPSDTSFYQQMPYFDGLCCPSGKLNNIQEGTHFRIKNNDGQGFIKGKYDENTNKYNCYCGKGWFLLGSEVDVVIL